MGLDHPGAILTRLRFPFSRRLITNEFPDYVLRVGDQFRMGVGTGMLPAYYQPWLDYANNNLGLGWQLITNEEAAEECHRRSNSGNHIMDIEEIKEIEAIDLVELHQC